MKSVYDYGVIPGEKVKGKDISYVQKTGQWSLVLMFTVQPRCDKKNQLWDANIIIIIHHHY